VRLCVIMCECVCMCVNMCKCVIVCDCVAVRACTSTRVFLSVCARVPVRVSARVCDCAGEYVHVRECV